MMKDTANKSENIQAGMKILEKQNRRREIKRRKLQNSGKDFEEIQQEKAISSVIKVVNRVNFKLKFESFAELLKNQIKCEKVVFYLKLKQSRKEKDIFKAWKHLKDCSKLTNRILLMLCNQIVNRKMKETLAILTNNSNFSILMSGIKSIFMRIYSKRLYTYFSIFKNQPNELTSAKSLIAIEKLSKLARHKGFCILSAVIRLSIYMKTQTEQSMLLTTCKKEHLIDLRKPENYSKMLAIRFASEKLSKFLIFPKFRAFFRMKPASIHPTLKLSASLLLLACSKLFKKHKKFAFTHLKSERIFSLYCSCLSLLTNTLSKKQIALKRSSLFLIKKHTNIKKSRYPIWKQKFYQLEGFIKYKSQQRSLIIKKQKFLRWKTLVERLSRQNKKHIKKVCKKIIDKLQPIFDKYQHKAIY